MASPDKEKFPGMEYTYIYIHIAHTCIRILYTRVERKAGKKRPLFFLFPFPFFSRARKDDAAKGVGHSSDHFQTHGGRGGWMKKARSRLGISRDVLTRVPT